MFLDLILQAAARRPLAPAIVTPDGSISFSSLAAESKTTPSQSSVVVVSAAGGRSPAAVFQEALAVRRAGFVPLLLAPEERSETMATVPSLPSGTAWLRTTSGTTGAPRLLAATDEQMVAAAMAHARLTGLEAGQVCVVTVPPWTSFGWNCWCGTLAVGATVRYVPPSAPRDLLTALAATPDVAWGCTTPPVVRALARLAPASASASRRARLLTASARYPEAETLQVLERHNVEVIDRYGTSETGPIAQARERGGRLFVAPDVSIRILDTRDVLEVTSPGVAIGDATQKKMFSGVFVTADRARIDEDGGFVLLGRADRVVKRMGHVVDLEALERSIVQCAGVRLARVRAEPTALDVELRVEIVPLGGEDVDALVATLTAALRSSLPPWQRPSRIDVRAADLVADDGAKWQERTA